MPPDYNDILAASERLSGHAVATPVLESPDLNDLIGGRLLVKAEMLQLTGSFKFRGAFNKLSQLTEKERKSGVVAYSSGNHAQGVAAAAKMLGIPAVIVMPADAPAMKIANTRAYGAKVVLYDRWTESREAIGGRIAEERGSVLVKPFDDPDIIAGQGTSGLELARQAKALGAGLDAVLVPVSGGGLVAGVALAVKAEFPKAEIYGVEPEGFDDLRRSLEAGQRVANDGQSRSFCDALMAPMPGEITFPIHQRFLSGGLAVSDAEVSQAMKLAFERLKLVVEPGGAVALAAVLNGRIDCRGRTIAVICSGGNVDSATFARAIAG
ncbi:threonine/serine dehydratase [Telmatospirillum sp. J64-1]|uniref:threonine ammonia-lyase n=1 Tax=Telmatospirillum sp. J64-1 TaxID=2502183 RepID=UPI00115F32DA|nr:threonine/serine dehydratase [Telmatospirillum sp. J64-1]